MLHVFSLHGAQTHSFSTSPAVTFRLLAAVVSSERRVLADLTIEDDVWCIDESVLFHPTTRRAFSEGRVLVRSGNAVGSACAR